MKMEMDRLIIQKDPGKWKVYGFKRSMKTFPPQHQPRNENTLNDFYPLAFLFVHIYSAIDIFSPILNFE